MPNCRLVLLMVLLAAGGEASAVEPIAVPGDLERLTADEVDSRSRFLTERLDDGRFSAQVWQYGWTGLFAASTVTNAVTLVTGDSDDRVVGLVDGVKSAAAVAQLVTDPLPARLGARPMLAVPVDNREGRLQRLAVGERQLVINAVRAESRYSLQRHLEGITTNLIGGAFIWAFGDSGDAIRSTLVGIAVGEAHIWSQPWRAAGDLSDYRAAFPTTLAAPGIRWELRPMGTGLQLALRF